MRFPDCGGTLPVTPVTESGPKARLWSGANVENAEEPTMKNFRLAAAAALLMTSTAAHAGGHGRMVSVQIEGQTIRVEVPKNCDQLSCIQIAAPGLSKSAFNLKGLNLNHLSDDDDADDSIPASNATPAPTKPQAPVQAAAPQSTAPAVSTASTAATTTVASTAPAPALHDVVPGNPPPAPVIAAPVARPAPAAAAPASAVAANTPVGIWRTERDKGNVRIEPCGQNLCGYAVGSGEKILINMKPEDSKWIGRIHDPDSGRNYDSTIAMSGPNRLRVQGCAFGGLFCGGQTWKRVS